jgi:hypothetical protein
MRPAGRAPKLMFFLSAEVYAPWCEHCGSDDRTKWLHLPALGVIERDPLALIQALCLRCENLCPISNVEAWQAREPERMAERLAGLRSGAV